MNSTLLYTNANLRLFYGRQGLLENRWCLRVHVLALNCDHGWSNALLLQLFDACCCARNGSRSTQFGTVTALIYVCSHHLEDRHQVEVSFQLPNQAILVSQQ
jgi:hypothetical protein